MVLVRKIVVENRIIHHECRARLIRGSGDVVFFFQAEDGIRDLVRSRGLGDVYKRQH